MNRHIHAGRAILMSMLFVMVSSSPMPGQGDPVEMIAGKSRTFNRHSLKVLDGPMNPAFMIADPVSSVTGEFVESATDLSVRALGMDFSFSRTWRSMADYVGPLGRGWDTPINERLVAQVDGSTGKITGVHLFDGNGRSDYFYRWDLIPNEPAAAQTLHLGLNLVPTHGIDQMAAVVFALPTQSQLADPPAYFYAPASSGINEIFERKGDKLYRFVPGKFVVEYTLTLRLDQLIQGNNLPGLNQTIEDVWGEVAAVVPITIPGILPEPIDSNELCFRVSQRRDLYGNEHNFNYTNTHPSGVALTTDELHCITDDRGCDITFTYCDAQSPYPGGIETVSDLHGRSVFFEYDSAGNMISVARMPGSSEERKTLYTYGPLNGGNYAPLLTIENPEEAADPINRRPVVRNKYVGRRVIQQEWGDAAVTPTMAGDPGNPGEPCFFFAYTLYPASLSMPLVPETTLELQKIQSVLFTRRDGADVTYTFTVNGEAEGYSVQEDGRTFFTGYEWENGKLTKLTHPSPDLSIASYRGKVEEFSYNSAAPDPRDRGQLLERRIHPEINGAPARGESTHVWTYADFDPKWQEPTRTTTPEGVVHETTRTIIGTASAPTGYTIAKTSTGGTDVITSSKELDPFGRVVKVTGALGRSLISVYAPYTENVIEVTAEYQGTTDTLSTYVYDAFGRLLVSTDSTGATTSRSYNSFDEVVERTSATGVKTGYTFNRNGIKTQTSIIGTDGVPFDEDLTLDILGNILTTRVDRTGAGDFLTTTLAYDASSRLVSVIEPSGLRTEFVWGKRDQLLAMSHGANTPSPINTSYVYNHADALLISTNNEGSAWYRTYDKHMRLVEELDPLGNKKRRVLTGTNETEVHWQDSQGIDHRATKSAYDDLSRLITQEKLAKIRPGGADIGDGWLTKTNAVDAAGRITSQTDENGAVATTIRDHLGRHVELVDSLGNTTNYTYLGDTKLVTSTTEHLTLSDNPGVIVKTRSRTNSYDASHRLIAATDFSGAATQYLYDFRDRLIQTIDPLGNVSERDLDAIGNVLKERRIENQGGTLVLIEEVENQYDSFGRLYKTIDGEGRTTIFEFDAFDRVTSKTLHDSTEYTWTFDQMGRVATYQNPIGSTISTTYDAMGRPSVVTKSGGAGVIGDLTPTILTYDPFGTVATATDGDSHVWCEYNTLGGLYRSTQSVDGGIARTFTASFGSIGERSAVDYPDFGGGAYRVEYDYDSRNQLARQRAGFAGSLSQIRSLIYEGPGRVVQTSFALALTKSRSLDERDFIGSVSYADAQSNLLFGEGRLSDDLGREIWRRIEYGAGGTAYHDRVTHSAHDGASRLTSFCSDVTAPTWSNVTPASAPITFGNSDQLTWSPAGMRLGINRQSGGDDTLTYNAVHDLIAATIGTVSHAYQVDATGNRKSEWTAAGAISYAYDIDDHLARVIFENGDRIDYAYDVAGRRIQEIAVSGGATTIRRFYHDDMTRAVEVEVTDGLHGTSETPVAWNVYAEVVGSPVLTHMQNAQGTFVDVFPITDSRGSVVVLVDALGSVFQHYRYLDEFGRRTLHAGIGATPVTVDGLPLAHRFSWKGLRTEASPATSNCLLYESGGRVFDALVGSYLQRNPLAAQHGKSDTPSATQDSLSGRFSYPGANPQGELLAFNWPSKPGPPPQLHKDRWPVARGPLTGGGGGLAGGGSWWWWR